MAVSKVDDASTPDSPSNGASSHMISLATEPRRTGNLSCRGKFTWRCNRENLGANNPNVKGGVPTNEVANFENREINSSRNVLRNQSYGSDNV